MKYGPVIFAVSLAVLAFALLVPPWAWPINVKTTQTGPDASSMGLFLDTAELDRTARQPDFQPAVAGGPSASAAYSNVTVLGDLSKAEFDRTMQAVTAWVAPDQGCAFCHGGQTANYAADYPRKEIARRMLRMVRDTNARWTNHVGARGVTCFTCHQGENVPKNKWFVQAEPEPPLGGIAGKPQPWHTKGKTIRDFFPSKPEEEFLLKGVPINQVQAKHALAQADTELPQRNLDYAENVYILMMQMSQGIGANCTLCHQSRSLFDWSQSPPERLHGYSGIKMTVGLNQTVFAPLAGLARPEATGPQGDPAKVNCGSCHNQRVTPVGGMLQAYYPGLVGPPVAQPANPVAAANPDIWQLAQHPVVGRPETQRKGWQPAEEPGTPAEY